MASFTGKLKVWMPKNWRIQRTTAPTTQRVTDNGRRKIILFGGISTINGTFYNVEVQQHAALHDLLQTPLLEGEIVKVKGETFLSRSKKLRLIVHHLERHGHYIERNLTCSLF